MQATAHLLRTRGYGGLRTVEVSELAGVSRGAQLHHFPNKNALVIATMHYLNDSMMAASERRAARALEGGDPLELVIADALDFFFGDFFFIMLAVGMSDERNQELIQGLDPMIQKGRLQIEQEWQRILEASGLPRELAADVLTMTLALVRGFSVRQLLIETDREQIDRLILIWRQIVGEYIRTKLAR